MILGIYWGINQPNHEGNANACGYLIWQPLILWDVGFNDWLFHD
jgi:hypothetical protein